MIKINKRFSYFWKAVHPIFRGALFLWISYISAVHALPQLNGVENAGSSLWLGLFSFVFLCVGLHTLLWGEDNLLIQEPIQ